MSISPKLSTRAAVAVLGFAVFSGGNTALAQFSGTPITFNSNGGWCWFQDPRCVISNGRLFIGSIAGTAGNGSSAGDADVTSYNLQTNVSTETLLHAALGQDDHDCPAFAVLPDGRILAEYATHGANNFVYWRIGTSPSLDQRLGLRPERLLANHAFRYNYGHARNRTPTRRRADEAPLASLQPADDPAAAGPARAGALGRLQLALRPAAVCRLAIAGLCGQGFAGDAEGAEGTG
jgi:hypothetical protein